MFCCMYGGVCVARLINRIASFVFVCTCKYDAAGLLYCCCVYMCVVHKHQCARRSCTTTYSCVVTRLMSAQDADDLREPTTARSRLRQARQREAAALYNATFERRVDGNISSVRVHPKSSLHVHSYQERDNVPVVGGAPHRSAADCAPKQRAAVMEGRVVNVMGQCMDGPAPAINRLLQGDFYCVRGGAVQELNRHGEGKHMRFRSTAGVVDASTAAALRDGTVVGKPRHDAATMTKQPKASSKRGEEGRRGHSSSPHKHSHGGSPSKHHCHHGHRAAYSGGSDEEENIYKWRSSPRNRQRHDSPSKRRPHSSSERRGDDTDDDDDHVKYMAPLNLDQIFADKQKKSLRHDTAKGQVRAASAAGHRRLQPSYQAPTLAYATKTKPAEEHVFVEHHTQSAAPRPATARQTRKDPYETSLGLQKGHPPGHAAIVSQKELHNIMTLVAKPTQFSTTEQRHRSYKPADNGNMFA